MKTHTRLTFLESDVISFSYSNFRTHVQELLEKGLVTGDKQGEDMVAYSKMNETRMNRIEKHGLLSDELKSTLKGLNKKIQILCITEGWCGDSAQILPYVALMCQENEILIDFEIILRDTNPQWMDKYLTNGGRSIPIFVVFDENGNELFHWGPRPNALAEEMKGWKASTDPVFTLPEIIEKVHLWYARDKGSHLMLEWQKLLASIG